MQSPLPRIPDHRLPHLYFCCTHHTHHRHLQHLLHCILPLFCAFKLSFLFLSSLNHDFDTLTIIITTATSAYSIRNCCSLTSLWGCYLDVSSRAGLNHPKIHIVIFRTIYLTVNRISVHFLHSRRQMAEFHVFSPVFCLLSWMLLRTYYSVLLSSLASSPSASLLLYIDFYILYQLPHLPCTLTHLLTPVHSHIYPYPLFWP